MTPAEVGLRWGCSHPAAVVLAVVQNEDDNRRRPVTTYDHSSDSKIPVTRGDLTTHDYRAGHSSVTTMEPDYLVSAGSGAGGVPGGAYLPSSAPPPHGTPAIAASDALWHALAELALTDPSLGADYSAGALYDTEAETLLDVERFIFGRLAELRPELVTAMATALREGNR